MELCVASFSFLGGGSQVSMLEGLLRVVEGGLRTSAARAPQKAGE
jgi:hypothetical protein